MKSEDFITRYMGSDLWENPYYQKKIYEIEEPPPDEDPGEVAWWDDRSTWLELRDLILQNPITLEHFRKFDYEKVNAGQVAGYDVQGQDGYRFIRKVMEKITNPYGGYLYRRFHYLGYTSTLGLLIPQGFVIDEELTVMANYGREVPWSYGGDFIRTCVNLGLIDVYNTRGKPIPTYGNVPAYNLGGDKKYVFKQNMWLERYVVIYSRYWDFPNYWVDDIINAMINDMYMARIRIRGEQTRSHFKNRTVMPNRIDHEAQQLAQRGQKFYIRDVEYYHLDKVTQTLGRSFSLGWLVSEMIMLFNYMKRTNSAIPFPVFPNFGFKGTMPSALIDANIGAIMELLDDFFKISSKAGPKRGKGYGYQERDPVMSYINSASGGDDGGSSPPPPPSSPPTGYSDRGYQE